MPIYLRFLFFILCRRIIADELCRRFCLRGLCRQIMPTNYALFITPTNYAGFSIMPTNYADFMPIFVETFCAAFCGNHFIASPFITFESFILRRNYSTTFRSLGFDFLIYFEALDLIFSFKLVFLRESLKLQHRDSNPGFRDRTPGCY